MSPLPQDRNTLSTYRMVFAYIGSFIALLLFMPMVRFFSGNSDELADQQHGWTMAVVVIAIPVRHSLLWMFRVDKRTGKTD